jgi:hypothetical protein
MTLFDGLLIADLCGFDERLDGAELNQQIVQVISPNRQAMFVAVVIVPAQHTR